MKYVKTAALILTVVLVMSGCNSFKLASSIDDLIAPVSPSGNDAGIQSAMDEYCKGGYSVKIPAGGEYTTSFIYYDFNGDNTDEAIAFYEPADNLGEIDMAVLACKSDDKWSVIANVSGEGSDVYSADFCDINGDGAIELLISWNVITNSSNHVLDIYSQKLSADGNIEIEKITDGINYSSYITVDMDSDGVDELLVLSIDQTHSAAATAELFSIKDKKIISMGKTKVDGHVLTYKNLSIGRADSNVAVYADALKSDGESMITEILYWSKGYESVISPFYSYSTGLTSDTTRKALINSCDIDGDGSIEIPVDASTKTTDGVYSVEWKQYNSSVLVHAGYSFAMRYDNYQIMIPDSDFNNLIVKYDKSTRVFTMQAKKDKTDVLSIMPMLKTHYEDDKDKYSEYTVVLDNSGYVYLARVNKNASVSYTLEQLSQMIKTY